jgi:flagellar biosynthetic protein FliR
MIPDNLVNWFLVFARVTAMLAIFPLFSGGHVPVQLRIALGALLAYLVAASLPPMPVQEAAFGTLIGLVALETGVGLLLGFIARMIFYALDAVGNVLARELGLFIAGELNPFTHDQSETPGLILYMLGIMLFLTLDLHHWMLAGFQRSYQLLPIGGAHLTEKLAHNVIRQTAGIFTATVQISAPVIALSLLVNVIFASLGRAVQQINVFTESFAFRSLAGLAMFGLSLNLMAQHIANYLRRLPEDMLRVAQLLGAR